jgi:hypothetical protein
MLQLAGDLPWLTLNCRCCNVQRRGSALLSRVAVDSFDCSACMRIVRPLRNIMRVECEAALVELAPPQQQQEPLGVAGLECDAASVSATVGGSAKCIGELMTAFVTLLQVLHRALPCA